MVEDDIVSVVLGRFDELVIRGLLSVLEDEPRVRVLASGLGPDEIARATNEYSPRVAVLNDTVEHALVRALKSCPSAPGIVLLAHSPSHLLVSLLAAEGIIVLTPNAHEQVIIRALYSVAGRATERMRSGTSELSRITRDPTGLTKREIQVLELLILGRSYVEIGAALHISPTTVRTHSDNIRKKLHVPSKRALIGYAAGDSTQLR